MPTDRAHGADIQNQTVSRKGDGLGDRMKMYEAAECSRTFIPMLPIYARIDGRSFSRFTKGMCRPYDAEMSRAMVETTRYLVEQTHARIGYTQSDEISLVWLADNPKSDVFFAGKIAKITSVLAGMATAAFMREILRGEYADRVERCPHFDCRAFQLPNKTEAANTFLWREKDATKNAITMAAGSLFSHRELQGKSSADKQEMLFSRGVNFNDYPAFFKRGSFLRRETEERALTDIEWEAIPISHRPERGRKFMRSSVKVLEMPPFGGVTNREAVIFEGEEPK